MVSYFIHLDLFSFCFVGSIFGNCFFNHFYNKTITNMLDEKGIIYWSEMLPCLFIVALIVFVVLKLDDEYDFL